jgi:PAS domain S-box-containing protein
LGYTPEELYAHGGNVIASLVYPGDIPMVTEHLAGFAGAKDSELREVEYRLKDARGNWRWIQARETVFRRDDNGIPVQITGVSRDVTERKKAEEEIRFKNKIIDGILSNLPVILCRIDEEGVIRESVGAGLQQLGRQDGQIVGENVFINIRYAGIAAYIRQVLQGGSITFVSQPVHQGKSFYFLNYYYFDPEQRMAVGFSLDISQQKETEEKLKRSEEQLRELNTGLERRVQERTAELTASEERYRAFVQQSSEAIWRFELDGVPELDASLPENEQIDLIYRHAYLAECNDTMAQMYGYDNAQEIIGARFADLTPPNEPANTEYLRSFIRARYRLANAESVEVDRAGNLKYFLNNLTGITREGNLIRAWGTQRDITDRKRAEDALREKELEYRSLVTATSQMIWYASPEGLITEDIPLWRRYTGQSREEVLGYGWTRALHPDDRERSEYTWKRSVERSQVFETEYRVRSKRGEYRWFFARSVPIFDRNGNIKRWIGACNDIHDRKLAEEALRISEERLELAVRAAGIGIFDWHIPEGTVILTEQEERIFGMAHGSFKGTLQGWMDFVLPEDYPELWRQLQSGMDRRDPGLYAQYRIRRTDGEIRWLEAVGKFIYNKVGTPMRAVGINVDITGRKLAEQALRESESRFRRLFESDMVGILFSDSTGVVTDANNAFLHLLGYTREDLDAGQIRGKDITPAEYTALDEAAGQELIAKGLIAPYEKEFFRKDGSRVAILIGTSLLKERTPATAVGFVLDISERKAAQEQLHLSEERFRLVAEATNEGIWDWDIRADQVWRNEGYYKLFGYQPGQTNANLESWEQRLHPEDAARVRRGVEGALHGNKGNWADEYRIQKIDGSYAYVMDRAYILRDGQGRPVRMIGSKIDLTALKETQLALEQQAIELKQSNADLEQFAYISSHDLQEPLNTAASFAKLLKRRYESRLDGDANDFIDFVVDATDRMKKIIRSLLEYSRVSSVGKEAHAVPLENVLGEVRKNLQPRLEETGADLQIGPMPTVRANETQLLQLFQNLVGNALKFRSSTAPNYGSGRRGAWAMALQDRRQRHRDGYEIRGGKDLPGVPAAAFPGRIRGYGHRAGHL